MKKTITISILTLCFHVLYSQTTYKYWVGFTDKKNNGYSVGDPSAYLSSRAIERRNKQTVAIDDLDLPVTKSYTDSLQKLGFAIQGVSKWMNGAIVSTNDSVLIDTLQKTSFVKETVLCARYVLKNKKDTLSGTKTFKYCSSPAGYGLSRRQIEMLNGHCIHQMGYRGEGRIIAVLDGGFSKVNTLPAFDSLRRSSRIIATRDFVNPSRDFYATITHGMQVLSLIGGNVRDTLIGTAPKAEFVLVITEDGETEFPVEEYLWSMGAEYADSLGADVISSSLGYSDFDDKAMDHTYKDMNGETTPCAKAAAIAVSRGMVVVCSAGNEGGSSWRYISTPGDAKDILTIGAVDSFRNSVYFSSHGPSSDGRVKPDICAMGYNSYIQLQTGSYGRGSGTSFSAPIAAGMVTCLWQAFPDKSNRDIMDAVRRSAHLYYQPDTLYGYGIPDFDKAYSLLKKWPLPVNSPDELSIFPNPFRDHIVIDFYSFISEPFTIEAYGTWGRKNYSASVPAINNTYVMIDGLEGLPRGTVIFKIIFATKTITYKCVKI